MEKPLILVIDPSEETRAMYGDYFQFFGYEVVEAANGAEGLRRAQWRHPDLIVTELSNEPEWIRALEALRSKGRGRKTPAILCSVRVEESWPFAPAWFDVDLALPKPISPRGLLLKAQEVLQAHSRAARAVPLSVASA